MPVVGLAYAGRVQIEFEGEIFRWEAREQEWIFVALPAELSEQIREIPWPRRGFGSVRVEARIGLSRWRTSIFPDATQGTYVLPLKRSVRDAHGIGTGGVGTADPGCLAVTTPGTKTPNLMTFTFADVVVSNGATIALPYGTWNIYRGGSAGDKSTLIGAGISLPTPGTISGNRVTLDPRVAR